MSRSAKKPHVPLSYETMAPEERARRQAIMDKILAKHERATRASAWLKERRPKLLEEVKAWDDCVLIRRYVETLDKHIAESGHAPEGFEAWRADALKVAEMLDPVKLRLKPEE